MVNKITSEELKKMLNMHEQYLQCIDNGKKANFDNIDLTGHTNALIGLDLSGCSFVNANMSGLNLTCVNLSESDLYGVNLANAKLHGAWSSRCLIEGANLENADFDGALIEGTNLEEAINADKAININKNLII